MKKFLTLRNCLVCVACLFGLLVLIFSFVTNVQSYASNGTLVATEFGSIWGATKGRDEILGITATIPEEARVGALALPLIGTLLVFGGAVCAVVALFVAPKKKVLFVVAGAVMVVGAVFVALTPLAYFNASAAKYAESAKVTIEQAKEAMKAMGGTLKAPLSIVSAILGVLGGAGVCVSAFLKK